MDDCSAWRVSRGSTSWGWKKNTRANEGWDRKGLGQKGAGERKGWGRKGRPLVTLHITRVALCSVLSMYSLAPIISRLYIYDACDNKPPFYHFPSLKSIAILLHVPYTSGSSA